MTTSTKLSPRRLNVYLGQDLVGSITSFGDDKSFFAFAPEYVDDHSRPTLSLSFRSASGGLLTDTEQYRMKLHPFFSNLLPEGHLRDYLAAKIGINKEREFHLLSELGGDLPGAVVVTAADEHIHGENPATSIDFDERSDEDVLKFSLAGVQLKFSAINEALGGLTIPASGSGGDQIIKLPSSKYDLLPESEFASLHFAKMLGMNVAQARLVETSQIKNLPEDIPTNSGNSLALERFDRAAGERIHTEDFAQVFKIFPLHKYKNAAYHDVARVIWVMIGEAGLVEFVRRLVFTVAIGNADMHLKNWSLIYRNRITPELAPAYDFVPTIAFNNDRKLGLSLGGTKQMRDVELDHFVKFAAKADAPTRFVLKIVKESLDEFQTAWTDHKDELKFPPKVRETIDTHLNELALFKPK